MKIPKIAADDLMLFGSLFLAALGAALVVCSRTGDLTLGLGMALIVFGLPAAVITFMAASEETK